MSLKYLCGITKMIGLRKNPTHKHFLLVQQTTVKQYLTVQQLAIGVKTKQMISTIKKSLIVLMRENGDASA